MSSKPADLRKVRVLTQDEADDTPLSRGPRIVVPTEAEKERYQHANRPICGMCKHFHYSHGQREAHRQDFLKIVVKDLNHAGQWYADFKYFGICDVWSSHEDTALVHGLAPAKIPDQNRQQENCPHFHNRGESSVIKMFMRDGVTKRQ